MHRGPLFNSTNATEILGTFDPLHLGLTFAREPIHTDRRDLTRPRSGREWKSLTSLDDPVAAFTEAFADIPIGVIAHELAHLHQAATTSSGMRHFLDLHEYFTMCTRVIELTARRTGGTVPVGLGVVLDRTSIPDGLTTALDKLAVMFFRRVFHDGGIHIPLDALTPYRTGSGTGNLFQVMGIFPGDEMVWCLDLSDFDGPPGMAITLGNIHLYEGQAMLAELLRELRDQADRTPDGPFVSPLDAVPFHPYRVVEAVHQSMCDQRPEDAIPEEAELVYVIDAALMADDWATIPIETLVAGQYAWDHGYAFDYFLKMCDALGGHPEWSLRSLDVEDIRTFQNTLLRAAEAPVPDIVRLTAAVHERYPTVVDRVARRNPLLDITLGNWSQAFEKLLDDRVANGRGTGTLLPFVMQSAEGLALTAVTMSTMTSTEFIPITDEAGADHPAVRLGTAYQVWPVIEEILFGRRPCAVRAECDLPERAACAGLPRLAELQPVGRRCSRECAIAAVAAQTGITEFTIVEHHRSGTAGADRH